MRLIPRACFRGLLFLASLAFSVHAQVPGLLNYQGRVTVGGVNFNGNGQFKFALVNAAGAQTFWSNDNTSTGGGQPTAFVTVAVSNGLYSVLLGDTVNYTNMTAVPATVFLNSDVRLRVWFNDGTRGFQLLTPDQRLAPAPYAMVAGSAQTVPDGSITAAKLAPGAVVPAQIAPGSITATQIAAGTITAAQIAPGTIGAAQLAPGSVGPTQLSVSVGGQVFTQSGTFTAPAGVSYVFVTLVGGGGGGGAGDQYTTGLGIDNFSGGGGGAGGVLSNYPVPVTPGNTYTITIGAGGAGAASGTFGGSPSWSGRSGSAGSATDFGGIVQANGGGGGAGGTGLNEGGGGAGGAGGSTTAFANMGFTGTAGTARGGNNTHVGGNGGGSPVGTAGIGANGVNGNGANASGYGAGGGGGAPSTNGNGRGGNGSPGLAIIRY